jgi:hypothetical protein
MRGDFVMNTLEAYRLRMRLVERGYVPCPMRDGQPAEIPWNMPSESCVRGWATLHPLAVETGIVDLQTRPVTPVTEVPASEAELKALRKIKQRTKNQQRLEARRRAKGIPERSVWLQTHSLMRSKPWGDKSKSTYYRQRGKGATNAPNTAPSVAEQAE